MVVPTTQQVHPGSSVSIVLKQDQRTGTQVSGTVSEILTRGNHPRGIKVRLTNGRVGRVQRMLPPSNEFSNPLNNTQESEVVHSPAPPPPPPQADTNNKLSGRKGRKHLGTDYRYEEEVPKTQYSLDAFIKKDRRSSSGRPHPNPFLHSSVSLPLDSQSPQTGYSASHQTTIWCPICGPEFQGDELAVSYHVPTHFN